jgi:hypothetical protein
MIRIYKDVKFLKDFRFKWFVDAIFKKDKSSNLCQFSLYQNS